MSTSKTVVGLFKNMTEAERVAVDLQDAGIPRNTIKIVDDREREIHERAAGILGLLKRLFGTEHRMDFEHASTIYNDWVCNGGTLVAVNTDESHADQVTKILQSYGEAKIMSRTGKAGMEEKVQTLRSTEPARSLKDEETIPVFQEELHVGKRTVQRGSVRVNKHITETPVEETINLRDETVNIERHPLNRIASEADLKAFADSRVEMIETFEEPVVSKEVHVIEEITISRSFVDHEEKIRDKVRKTEVDLEGLAPEKLRDMDFRNDFSARFGKMGRSYSEYAPAYELGGAFAAEERYRNRDWASIENDVRRQWEARRPGSWKEFADAVRHGWESVRGRRAA